MADTVTVCGLCRRPLLPHGSKVICGCSDTTETLPPIFDASKLAQHAAEGPLHPVLAWEPELALRPQVV